MDEVYPMRINKYLAHQRHSTRKGADALIERGMVTINGRKAVLGDKVQKTDKVEVKGAKKTYRYYAFNKPREVITHSPQLGEKDVMTVAGLEGVFPVGRLDKDSQGLIILTDDGRITEHLLSPENPHEKEYRVTVAHRLRPSFAQHMEAGVDIGDHVTKRCKVNVHGDNKFNIILSEGKKHQIRRMCSALHSDVVDLERIRIMNIRLGDLAAGAHRPIEGKELETFLKSLGF
ncbi:MAG: pseudouridine synthase [Candidatus Paceibacterota bacterium]